MTPLTENAIIICDHGGKVKIHCIQSFVRIQGAAVCVMGDTLLKIISGCPNMAPTIKPCTSTLSVEDGTSSFIKINGLSIMLNTTTGGTDGTPPMATKYKVIVSGQQLVCVDK